MPVIPVISHSRYDRIDSRVQGYLKIYFTSTMLRTSYHFRILEQEVRTGASSVAWLKPTESYYRH